MHGCCGVLSLAVLGRLCCACVLAHCPVSSSLGLGRPERKEWESGDQQQMGQRTARERLENGLVVSNCRATLNPSGPGGTHMQRSDSGLPFSFFPTAAAAPPSLPSSSSPPPPFSSLQSPVPPVLPSLVSLRPGESRVISTLVPLTPRSPQS